MSTTLRAARPAEATDLSALVLRSKAYWGYDDAFLAACADELSIRPDALADPAQVWRVAEDDGRVIGLYGLTPADTDDAEMEALFVEPEAIGTGVGRRLIEDAILAARRRHYDRIVIQGDPNAEGFYLAIGAKRAGERESGSIPGRFLPVFEIDLDDDLASGTPGQTDE